MPFIDVKTNTAVSDTLKELIKTELGTAITAIPGKSEAWLMVGIQGDYALYFRGTSDPAAMVEVSIFGTAAPAAFKELTARITSILTQRMGIPADRIYVKYSCIDQWGWNGSNF